MTLVVFFESLYPIHGARSQIAMFDRQREHAGEGGEDLVYAGWLEMSTEVELERFNVLPLDFSDLAVAKARQDVLLHLIQLRCRVTFVQLEVGEVKGLIDLIEPFVLAQRVSAALERLHSLINSATSILDRHVWIRAKRFTDRLVAMGGLEQKRE